MKMPRTLSQPRPPSWLQSNPIQVEDGLFPYAVRHHVSQIIDKEKGPRSVPRRVQGFVLPQNTKEQHTARRTRSANFPDFVTLP